MPIILKLQVNLFMLLIDTIAIELNWIFFCFIIVFLAHNGKRVIQVVKMLELNSDLHLHYPD